MYCAFGKQPINPATYFMSRWWHVSEDETGEFVAIEESCWGKSDFGMDNLDTRKRKDVVEQEKCIIRLDNEWLIVFWGEMNGEIAGIITYVCPAKILLKPRQ